jgi:hypothetical protein
VECCGRSRRSGVGSGGRRVGIRQVNASIVFNFVVVGAVDVVWRVN